MPSVSLQRTMGTLVLSLIQARSTACDSMTYLVWVIESEASLFREPGWEELQPHRNGAVLFLHRERELDATTRGTP
jgi:hypothetical protein